MALRVVTGSVDTIVTLDEAKAALRLDLAATDEDDFVQGLILAAQRRVEAETQRRFLTQTLEWVQPTWCDYMVLPVAPGSDSSAIEIDFVKYADVQGAQQTLDAATMYWARPVGPTLSVVRQWFAVWPWLGDAAEGVVIRFTITGTADDAPPEAKTAMKLLVSHWFRNRDAVVGVDNRDSSTPMPFGVEELVQPLRWNAV